MALVLDVGMLSIGGLARAYPRTLSLFVLKCSILIVCMCVCYFDMHIILLSIQFAIYSEVENRFFKLW